MRLAFWRACATLACFFSAGAACAQERILTFFDTIEVSPDGAVNVREKLSVVVTNEQIIHGIFRGLQTGHYGPGDRWVEARVDGVQVLRDGKAEPFTINTDLIRSEEIKIGDPNVIVDHGVHDYEITYRADKSVFVGNGIGAIRWNVTGERWVFPIDRVLASVALPPGTRITLSDAFSRGADRSGNNAVAAKPAERLAKFRTLAPLAPGDGMTVLVCFGFDGPPGRWTEAVAESDALIEQWCAMRTANNPSGMQGT